MSNGTGDAWQHRQPTKGNATHLRRLQGVAALQASRGREAAHKPQDCGGVRDVAVLRGQRQLLRRLLIRDGNALQLGGENNGQRVSGAAGEGQGRHEWDVGSKRAPNGFVAFWFSLMRVCVCGTPRQQIKGQNSSNSNQPPARTPTHKHTLNTHTLIPRAQRTHIPFSRKFTHTHTRARALSLSLTHTQLTPPPPHSPPPR